MSVTANKKTQTKIKPIAVDPNMPDYGKDPYFIKKYERGLALLKKVGIPETFKKPAKR